MASHDALEGDHRACHLPATACRTPKLAASYRIVKFPGPFLRFLPSSTCPDSGENRVYVTRNPDIISVISLRSQKYEKAKYEKAKVQVAYFAQVCGQLRLRLFRGEIMYITHRHTRRRTDHSQLRGRRCVVARLPALGGAGDYIFVSHPLSPLSAAYKFSIAHPGGCLNTGLGNRISDPIRLARFVF